MKFFMFVFVCTLFSFNTIADTEDAFLDLGDSTARELKMEINEATEKANPPVPQDHLPKKNMKKRSIASFKHGFKHTASTCKMFIEPDESSGVLLSVQSGKKLWLKRHDNQWLMAYSSKGKGYLSINCF